MILGETTFANKMLLAEQNNSEVKLSFTNFHVRVPRLLVSKVSAEWHRLRFICVTMQHWRQLTTQRWLLTERYTIQSLSHHIKFITM